MTESNKHQIPKEVIPDTGWLTEAKYRIDNEEAIDMTFEIAVRVHAILKEKNITQTELAKRLECSKQNISKILSGSENLTIKTIKKIEKVLGLKLIALVEEVDSSINAETADNEMDYSEEMMLYYRQPEKTEQTQAA